MKLELDFKEECKKLSSEFSDLEKDAERCARWVPGCFLNDSPLKTYLPLIEFIFPQKESDLDTVDKFFNKHEAEANKKRAAIKKLLNKVEKLKKEGKIDREIERDQDECDESEDEEFQAELAAEEAHEDEVMDSRDLNKIQTIDISDPDSFMRVAAYANRFKYAFNKLCSDENELCSDCTIKHYELYIKYQKPLRDKFYMLVGYWSAKYKDISDHHESRTNRSTETKRRNRETAKKIVIEEYRKFAKNYADKSDLLLMSERKILLRIKTAVDPALKIKEIYRNGISTNTVRQILREAKEKGKISSYPKHDV